MSRHPGRMHRKDRDRMIRELRACPPLTVSIEELEVPILTQREIRLLEAWLRKMDNEQQWRNVNTWVRILGTEVNRWQWAKDVAHTGRSAQVGQGLLILSLNEWDRTEHTTASVPTNLRSIRECERVASKLTNVLAAHGVLTYRGGAVKVEWDLFDLWKVPASLLCGV